MKNIKYKMYLFLVMFSLTTFADSNPKQGYKLATIEVEESTNLELKSVKVFDSNMTYLEQGKGDPVLFIHGNPTSSYLWRNVLPYAAEKSRAIAVDLIGMGGSDKPNIDYTFEQQYSYLSGFIEELELKRITLVGHDWGAALAWEYARNNPNQVIRLAFMEGVLPPGFPVSDFDSMGEEMGNMFRAFKDPEKGRELVIENNIFVEEVLPGFVNRTLRSDAMTRYRQPYLENSSRKPLLAWPRQVPIAGEPKSTWDMMVNIKSFMAKTQMPVLLLYAEPGVLTPPDAVPWYTNKIQNLESSFVGQGLHFIQEDQPDAIGRGLSDWMRRN